jgi:hypothetical protein
VAGFSGDYQEDLRCMRPGEVGLAPSVLYCTPLSRGAFLLYMSKLRLPPRHGNHGSCGFKGFSSGRLIL